MRTLSRLVAFALVASVGSSAFAREVEDGYGHTTISPAPVRSTTASTHMQGQGKKDANVPAKYDLIYPVRDHARATRERGAI